MFEDAARITYHFTVLQDFKPQIINLPDIRTDKVSG